MTDKNRTSRIAPVAAGLVWIIASLLIPPIAPCLLGGEASRASPPSGREGLKLVVVIVVDQLRGDAIARFGGALGKDGLLRIAREGVWFRNAHYSHAHTVTGVGHATIGTGARPSDHGIVGNDWFDRKTGARIGCASDAASPVVGTANEGGNASPINIAATTFADEWILHTQGRARAIGISEKDRGAMFPIGRMGKAFWYSSSSGRMVSSAFYFPKKELPEWVAAFDRKAPSDWFFKRNWERATRDDDGVPMAADDRGFEGDLHGMGKTFPHPLGKGMEKPESRFYDQVKTSPFGDQILMDFAIEAIRAEKLGQKETVDILTVSLSSNDLVGHTFGPDSVEAKEIFHGVDRQVARLLKVLESEVGEGRYLLALTGDHGVAFPPDVLTARGYPAGRYDTGDMLKKINRRLNFTVRYLDWSIGFTGAGYYFDPDALRYGGKPPAELEEIAAEVIREASGVAAVFTRTSILENRLPDTELARRVRAAYNYDRSPDVYVVADAYWIGGGTASHGEPYPYDSHVPLIFYGAGVQPQEVFRPVDVRDLAATISAVLGSVSPSACTGIPLVEVTQGVYGKLPATQLRKTF